MILLLVLKLKFKVLHQLDTHLIIELYHSHDHDFLTLFSHCLKINVTVAL